jgi:hypothetical protein
MGIRVPLLFPVQASIYRLDIQATWNVDPVGPKTEGYDYLYREPVIERDTGAREVTRVESGSVLVPCQVEMQTFEQLQAAFGGDNAATDTALVLHRKDLAQLSLLDSNNKCILKPGDRIDHLEKNGQTVLTWVKPMYVYEVRPRSWGFGPTGYDLEILYTTYRSHNPKSP